MELITYSFLLYLQHGRHDVVCTPSISCSTCGMYTVTTFKRGSENITVTCCTECAAFDSCNWLVYVAHLEIELHCICERCRFMCVCPKATHEWTKDSFIKLPTAVCDVLRNTADNAKSATGMEWFE